MSWVNDLASSLGIPAGAATLAVAMYGACAAAEKAARPEALHDIGRILNDSSWERSVHPSAIIERIFIWTFGERQLSWKCIWRSILGTFCITLLSFFFVGGLSEYVSLDGPFFMTYLVFFMIFFGIILLGIVPDYISLWKTRFLLSRLDRKETTVTAFVLFVVDACLSLIISLGFQFPVMYYFGGWSDAWDNTTGILASLIHAHVEGTAYFTISTMFTSLWVFWVACSVSVLKLLAPIRSFTAWFFDVDKHPVQAIGIVSGALVMVGAGGWSLVRWLA
jgi:hypothetical protein